VMSWIIPRHFKSSIKLIFFCNNNLVFDNALRRCIYFKTSITVNFVVNFRQFLFGRQLTSILSSISFSNFGKLMVIDV